MEEVPAAASEDDGHASLFFCEGDVVVGEHSDLRRGADSSCRGRTASNGKKTRLCIRKF